MAIRLTFSVSSKRLADDFKRECERRGHSQSYIIESAMRYFVEHPHSHGFSNGGEEAQAKKRQADK